MANVPFFSAGEVGLIKDLPADELDPRAWSDARNVRFADGKIYTRNGHANIFGTPTAAPFWLMPVQAGSQAFWVYSSVANLYVTDGATHATVTRAAGGVYTMDTKRKWIGGTLSNIPIITNGLDVPQMWVAPALASDFANLSNWPATDRCMSIKPFKSFLVALNITRSGTNYAHLVKWSHPAVPGAVPTSWDETDPTLQAGEIELVDELPGAIRNGLGLRDTFVIYKDNSVWGMQFIGGNNVFRFFPIFLQSGILSTHCVSTIRNGAAHFVATGEDFIVHDGQNAQSVFDRKIRNFIKNAVPSTLIDYCFTMSVPEKNEVWFCFPQAGGEFPTMAAIYNWKDETAVLKDLPANTAFADIGPAAESSDPWDADSATWDSDTTTWDLNLFSPHIFQIVSANPTTGFLVKLEDPLTVQDNWYVERTGIAVIGQDRVTGQLKADNDIMKLLDRIWPKGSGGGFNVQLGCQELKESANSYDTAQLFVPGVDKYKDAFVPQNGRFLSVKFSKNSGVSSASEIQGFNLNIQPLGDQ